MIFKKLIQAFVGQTQTQEGNSMQFGRYSDAHKALEKYDAWTRSTQFFEEKNYLQAYLEFFNYLQDDNEANVQYQLKKDTNPTTDFLIEFTLQQGSKIVRGFANQDEFVGEVKFIQLKNDLHVALGRKLVEMNYDLLYSGFSLDEKGVVWLRFTTNTIDSFAGKLYNGLREIATRTDSQDDLILNEFTNELIAVDDKHVVKLSDEVKQTKIKFLKQWISQILEEVHKHHPERSASAISYMLLTLLYRIDYLLTPEGTLTAQLEDIHHIVFYDQNRLPVERNAYAVKEFEKIIATDDAILASNFYETKATFGIAKPAYKEELTEIISKQLQAADWFDKNDQDFILPFVFEYIAGYCLFNYGLPRPAKALFHLYFQVVHYAYFNELGFEHEFCTEKGLNKNKIQAQIEFIINTWTPMYPNLKMSNPKISYKNNTEFSFYFFNFVKTLDYATV